jgi:hypothetical protein
VFWGFDLVLRSTVVLLVIFGCMGIFYFIFWIELLLWFLKRGGEGQVGRYVFLGLMFFLELFPAIRSNLLCRTPAQKDFHCYRG